MFPIFLKPDNGVFIVTINRNSRLPYFSYESNNYSLNFLLNVDLVPSQVKTKTSPLFPSFFVNNPEKSISSMRGDY